MKTLVLGLGNLLLGDEGIGVHAAQALQREAPALGAIVLDIGTAILDALPFLETAERVIVIDAVTAGLKPGEICRFNLKDALPAQTIGSLHGFDLTRVMALIGREQPPEVTVIGVEPAVIAWSLELSPPLKATFPDLLSLIRKEIRNEFFPLP